MARKILVNLDVTNNRVVNLADGSASTDAVTLQQLQAGIRGLDWKPNVRVAGTTNISLAAPGATINGVTMASGDRVLLKDQTAGAENGIWVWTGASSALTRAVDADTGTLTAGLAVTAVEGTVDGDVVWQLTTNADCWPKRVAGMTSAGRRLMSSNRSSLSGSPPTTAGRSLPREPLPQLFVRPTSDSRFSSSVTTATTEPSERSGQSTIRACASSTWPNAGCTRPIRW